VQETCRRLAAEPVLVRRLVEQDHPRVAKPDQRIRRAQDLPQTAQQFEILVIFSRPALSTNATIGTIGHKSSR
jgi:hypothetical protein